MAIPGLILDAGYPVEVKFSGKGFVNIQRKLN